MAAVALDVRLRAGAEGSDGDHHGRRAAIARLPAAAVAAASACGGKTRDGGDGSGGRQALRFEIGGGAVVLAVAR